MQTIKEKIQQRQLQILVHSYIYYELNENIISDTQWNIWAQELVDLQTKYPEETKHSRYYSYCKNFDGSTGMNLLFDDYIISRANYLLKIHQEKTIKKQPGLLF